MATKHTASKTTQKRIRVKANDVVNIRYTDNAKHHKPGSEATVHRVQAEKLVKKGVAEYMSAKDKPADAENEEK